MTTKETPELWVTLDPFGPVRCSTTPSTADEARTDEKCGLREVHYAPADELADLRAAVELARAYRVGQAALAAAEVVGMASAIVTPADLRLYACARALDTAIAAVTSRKTP